MDLLSLFLSPKGDLFKRIGDGNNKNPTCHVFKNKHTKWLRWCITASLNYKNTMINRITMETVACLRIKCHLKQNLIPSMLEWFYTEIMKYTCNVIKDQLCHKKIHYVILIKLFMQTFWNSSDRRTERAENHKDRQILSDFAKILGI
jgi:hypothetical protein